MSLTRQLTLGLLAFGGEMAGDCARAIAARVSKTGRIDQALRRLAATGAITVTGAGGIDTRVLRLTDDTRREVLGGVDPPTAWARPWDGVWRVVAFDIPETEVARRTRLRRRLHHCRFGWLQNSVWISPDPIEDFRAGLDGSGITPESLTYFEARCAGGESPDALVPAAWDFARLARDYEHYEQLLQARPSPTAGTAAAWLRWLQAENRAWRLVARRDPFLPAVLLPTDYRGRSAWSARAKALAEFARIWR